MSKTLVINTETGKGYFVTKMAGKARLEDIIRPEFTRVMGLPSDVDTSYSYVVVDDFNGIRLGIKPVEVDLWKKVREAYFKQIQFNEGCYEVEIIARVTVE